MCLNRRVGSNPTFPTKILFLLSEVHMNLPEIPEFDQRAFETAKSRQDSLTKPPGSLGKLEEIAAKVAGMQRSESPSFDYRFGVVAAADHGVVANGVSAYPQAVTAQMVSNFLAGGAAINVLADEVGMELVIVDAGVASELLSDERIVRAAVARGTADFTQGAAMSRTNAESTLASGIELGKSLGQKGRTAIVPGEMGIGNTTAAAAITSVFTGVDARTVTGRGTGVNEETLRNKISAVEQAITVNKPDSHDGLDVLAKVGGYEIGFLTGLIIGAASQRSTLVIDGYISTSALLIAGSLSPNILNYAIVGHRSSEPGHRIALDYLGLAPLLELDMRLGEGTGGAIALKVIDLALALHNGMATFEEASVSGPSSSENQVS